MFTFLAALNIVFKTTRFNKLNAFAPTIFSHWLRLQLIFVVQYNGNSRHSWQIFYCCAVTILSLTKAIWVDSKQHGSLNVPIEHHPTIRYMVYNGYYKVMSNIPKMGQLPTPEQKRPVFSPELRAFCPISQLVSPQNHGHGSPPTWRNLEHPRYVVPPKPEMFIG